MSTYPYHSVAARDRGYHTHRTCPHGARIPDPERRLGEGDLQQCAVCLILDNLQAPAPLDEPPSLIPLPRAGLS